MILVHRKRNEKITQEILWWQPQRRIKQKKKEFHIKLYHMQKKKERKKEEVTNCVYISLISVICSWWNLIGANEYNVLRILAELNFVCYSRDRRR